MERLFKGDETSLETVRSHFKKISINHCVEIKQVKLIYSKVWTVELNRVNSRVENNFVHKSHVIFYQIFDFLRFSSSFLFRFLTLSFFPTYALVSIASSLHGLIFDYFCFCVSSTCRLFLFNFFALLFKTLSTSWFFALRLSADQRWSWSLWIVKAPGKFSNITLIKRRIGISAESLKHTKFWLLMLEYYQKHNFWKQTN